MTTAYAQPGVPFSYIACSMQSICAWWMAFWEGEVGTPWKSKQSSGTCLFGKLESWREIAVLTKEEEELVFVE